MKRLRGRRALVTSGGAGIGRATALRLASEGAVVGVLDINADAATETVRMITDAGGRAVRAVADVSDEAAVTAAVTSVADALTGLDTLVTSAGIAVPGSVTELDAAGWERVVGVNLRGIWLSMKHAIPLMRAAGGGAVVNVTSNQALMGFAGWAGYASTKGGIIGLTRQAAVEYAPDRVRVNSVAPGTIMTPLNEAILRDADDPDEVVRTWNSLHALGRFGQPAEVAAAIAFLASDDASFVTGVCLPVDGGATIMGASGRSH